MTRFFGWLLTLAGGAATLWGGYYVMTGQSSAQLPVTDTISVSAMITGLVGVATLTLGLIWTRD